MTNRTFAPNMLADYITPAPRNCVGMQAIAVGTGSVSSLTIPGGAIGANIQADGGTLRITIDGKTAPAATVGQYLVDGNSMNIDTPLANVQIIAIGASTRAQVFYFDAV